MTSNESSAVQDVAPPAAERRGHVSTSPKRHVAGASDVRRSERDISPIFIVGSARSGTTLLQMMLNAHPDVAIAGELHYFDQILQLRRAVPDLETPERIDRLFDLLPTTYGAQFLAGMEAPLAATRERLKAEPRPTYETLFRHLLETYAEMQGARRCGEKTPENIRYLEQLAAIFPACKIIHIIRDPRANVASRLKMPWTSDDVVVNALKWKIDILCGEKFASSRPNRDHLYHEVLYERLVSNPEEELRRICRFIGEEYDERMLRYHESSRRFVKGEPWKEGTFRPAHTRSLEAWRRELSPSQVFLVEAIARPLMRRYGYRDAGTDWQAKVVSPLVFLREIVRYGAYKVREQRERARAGDVIYGDSAPLYGMLFRSLFRRNN